MKNIHILPTNKPSRLHLIEDTLTITSEYKNSVCDAEVNIYITSDEEIKDVRPHKGKWQLEKGLILNKFPDYLTDLSECKLIILTTDQDLINDGVQAIDDEFLEWFVKNPSCEEVEVEVEVELVVLNEYGSEISVNSYGVEKFGYKIIIPKEEPKQETLEEAAKNYANYNEQIHNAIKEAVKFGAEWQQERMYSEEEVLEIIRQYALEEHLITSSKPDIWFEQFKKK